VAIDLALAWRGFSLLMLGWLAVFFGRTLLPGREALITRIARVSDPQLAPDLVRYTRALTGVWSAYFVAAALAAAAWGGGRPWLGPMVGAGAALLFVIEHRLRKLVFPGRDFPALRQQLQDTVRAWRT
jgi:uncharacterized membrane protein